MEGHVQLRNMLNIFADGYCVLSGLELTVYSSADAAKDKKKKPEAKEQVEVVQDWDGKGMLNTYENGVLIECKSGKKLQMLAPSAEEKESWLAVNGHLAVTRSAMRKLEKGIITKEEFAQLIEADTKAKVAWAKYCAPGDLDSFAEGISPLRVRDLDSGEAKDLTTEEVDKLFDEHAYNTFKQANTTLVGIGEGEQLNDDAPPENKAGGLGMSDFKLRKLLGKGAFGTVVLAELKSSSIKPNTMAFDLVQATSNRFFAIKILRKLEMSSYTKHRTQLERQIMARVAHPFIAALKFSFQSADKLYLGMEFFQGGDLFHHLRRDRRRRGLGMSRSKFYTAELVSALAHLHALHIVYRDLKPSNVMIDVLGHVRLVDFGLCKQQVVSKTAARTFVGTRAYVAPEVIRMNFKYSWLADSRTTGPKQKGYGAACDWWSLGILLYEMLLGETPFDGSTPQMTFDNILNKHPRYPSKMPADALSILKELLRKDPRKRLGCYPGLRDACSVKEHPFLSSIKWDEMLQLKIRPPWTPTLDGTPTDMKYVDLEFAGVKPEDTASKRKLTAQERQREHFEHFTYVLRVPSEADGMPTEEDEEKELRLEAEKEAEEKANGGGSSAAAAADEKVGGGAAAAAAAGSDAGAAGVTSTSGAAAAGPAAGAAAVTSSSGGAASGSAAEAPAPAPAPAPAEEAKPAAAATTAQQAEEPPTAPA
jgi:serine/threonine protein kinase